jgi:hypothetical protein
MSNESKISTAVLVGIGTVGLVGLAMWGLDKASESHAEAFGLAPAFRGISSTDRSRILQRFRSPTVQVEPFDSETPTDRMDSSSSVQTLHDLLREPNPSTSLRRHY